MKNYYLTKLPKQLLLFAFFLTTLLGYFQKHETPIKDLADLRSYQPKVHQNFFVIIVTLSQRSLAEVQAGFVKLPTVGFYYVNQDNYLKTSEKDELEIALQLQQSNSINKTPIINLKINS